MKLKWIFLLTVSSSFLGWGQVAFAGEFTWNLSADGRYAVQVVEDGEAPKVYLRNSVGTWTTTSERLKTAFYGGLRVVQGGHYSRPVLLEGFPPPKVLRSALSSPVVIKFYGQELAEFLPNKEGKWGVREQKPLSVFDIRQFSTDDSYAQRFKPVKKGRLTLSRALETDLHSHFAGDVSFSSMMKIGVKHDLPYTVALLDKIGVKYPISAVVDGKIGLRTLLASKEFKASKGLALFEDAMTIEQSHVRTFVDMETKYIYRGDITKNLAAFGDLLWEVARAAKKVGTTYKELSISNIILPAWANAADKVIEKIEEDTGVRLRFIVGLWRHSDPEWNLDEITRTEIMAKNWPYIKGIDWMGHETNSSEFLKPQIEAGAKLREEFGAEWQLRVHSGENALTPSNVRVAVEAGANRIGHGLYIEKDMAAMKVDPHTGMIDRKVIDLLKDKGVVIELNPPSNQALNNLSGGANQLYVQFKQFREAGVPVVIGTDGMGMYGANPREIRRMLTQLGFTESDFDYIRESEKRYVAVQEGYLAKAKTALKAVGTHRIPSSEEIEAYVQKKGQRYTEEVANARKAEYQKKLTTLIEDLHGKGIKPFDEERELFKGMRAIDVSGGSMSQFAAVAKQGPNALETELKVTEIRKIFAEMLPELDPKKVFFITGGTQFGVEEILHEEIGKYNAKNPGNEFKILGVMPDVALIEENMTPHIFGPKANGISHYKFGGRGWSDFGLVKLEILQEHGGVKIGVAGKMFVADEFRYIINADLKIAYMFHKGPVGASTDLAIENTKSAYTSVKELLSGVGASEPQSYFRAGSIYAMKPEKNLSLSALSQSFGVPLKGPTLSERCRALFYTFMPVK